MAAPRTLPMLYNVVIFSLALKNKKPLMCMPNLLPIGVLAHV